MRDQELIGLYEAYQQVHGLQEAAPLQTGEESLEIGQSPTPGGKTKKTPVIPPLPPKGTKVNTGYKESYDEPNVLGRLDNLAREAAGRVGGKIGERRGRAETGNLPVLGDIGATIGRGRGTERGKQIYDNAKETVGGLLKQSYEYDLYDTILEYLISEGYADTNEAALAIMASMSEDWKEEIINEAAADQSDKQIDKGVKKTHQAGNVLDNTHQGRSPGLNKLPRGERTAKKERMRKRLETRRDDLFGERRNREDERRS